MYYKKQERVNINLHKSYQENKTGTFEKIRTVIFITKK